MIRSSSLNKGMTLVELLVAIGISMVVMVAVTTFEVNIFRYQRDISSSFTTTQDAQVIMKTLAKELRLVSPSSTGSYGIAYAGSTTITFFADLKGDGLKEQVRYSLADGIMSRAVIIPSGSPLTYSPASESTTTIFYNLKNSANDPVFEYFDSSYDGSQTALVQPVTVTNIRLIRVNAVLASGLAQSTTTRTYSTSVTLRNFKDNL